MRMQRGVAYTRTFLMVDSTDHISGKTGATVTVKISKAGATGGNPSGGATATQVDSTNHPGLYKIAISAADTDTRGDLAYHATATGCDPNDWIDQVEDDGIYHGTITGAATTSSLIDSNLNQGNTDWWKGRIVIMTTGTAKLQAGAITAFDFSLDKITFDTMAGSGPSTADDYMII
jgi:hypothetical protein